MTAITAFRQELFQPIREDFLQSLNKPGSVHYYCVVGNQLGIEERKGDGSTPGLKDLKAISAFVREALSDKTKLDLSLEGKAVSDKIYLHVKLTQISAYISNHNHRVNESSLIGFVHVLLLILTLGMFKYRDTLQIEQITSSFEALGVTDKSTPKNNDPFWKIPFVTLLAMLPKDREFLLEKAGMLEEWQEFLKERPELLEARFVEPAQEAFLAPITLGDLADVADLNDTPLALVFPKEKLDVKEEQRLADEVLVPYLGELKSYQQGVFSHVPSKILSQLSLKDLFAFTLGQQMLLLQGAGLAEEWYAFDAARPNLSAGMKLHSDNSYLGTFRLETLQKASSIENTSLALIFPREKLEEMFEIISWVADKLSPGLKAMSGEERKAFLAGLPNHLTQTLRTMSHALSNLEAIRPMLAGPMGAQVREQLLQERNGKEMVQLLDISEAQIAALQELLTWL